MRSYFIEDLPMDAAVVVKRSDRKTVSLSVTKELKVLIRVPYNMSGAEIEKLLERHKKWIEKHLGMQKEKNDKVGNLIFPKEKITELKERAKEIIPGRVRYFAGVTGFMPTRVKITSAGTRWGSCSGGDGLCFSYRTALLPPDVIDYIILHELAHIKVKNHSPKFYREIEKYMPDYKERIAGLKKAQKELGI